MSGCQSTIEIAEYILYRGHIYLYVYVLRVYYHVIIHYIRTCMMIQRYVQEEMCFRIL